METKEQIAQRTKEIYIKQHRNYADDVVFERFYKMVSDPAYYHLTIEDFKGKKVLDAGCGNTAYFEVAMLDMGVASVTCLDLGEDWIPELKSALITRDADLSKIEFIGGSTDDLPFDDGSFDLVFSNGVLMHLVDEPQIEEAFKELCRVTKKGGYFYCIAGVPGGLMEEKIFPAVREYYNENPDFKEFIDNIKINNVRETIAGINEVLAEQGKAPIDATMAETLFDVDYITYLQNVIQAPTRHIFYIDEEWSAKSYTEYGFEDPKRCRRFVERKNIRQFLAPLQYNTNLKLGKLLFGGGNLEFISKKIN